MPHARRAAAVALLLPVALAAAPMAGAAPAAVGPTAATAWAPPGPHVKVTLTYKRIGRTVTMNVALTGSVYVPIDSDGRPIRVDSPATIDVGMGQSWTWGDKSIEEGTDGGGVHCGRPHRLVRLKDDFTLTKRYQRAGTYTFDYAFLACGLKGGQVAASLPITVR